MNLKEELKEGTDYLVRIKSNNNRPLRVARFNGFGIDKGWGGQDWSGDSGHSTDSWMNDEVEWAIPIDKVITMLETLKAVGY